MTSEGHGFGGGGGQGGGGGGGRSPGTSHALHLGSVLRREAPHGSLNCMSKTADELHDMFDGTSEVMPPQFQVLLHQVAAAATVIFAR